MESRVHASLVLLAISCLAACREAPVAPKALGPSPVIELTAVFGTAPLSGILRVTPAPGSSGWRWRVRELGTEGAEVLGVADEPASIPYRYDVIGVHRVRVELTGPAGPVVVERRVVVHDSATELEVVGRRSVGEIWQDRPEGMTIDPSGQELFAAAYLSGELVRLSGATLETLGRRFLPHRVQALTVTPAGNRLLTVHEKAGVTIVDLPGLEVGRRVAWGRWYARALDEDRVLVAESGAGKGEGLLRVDLADSEIEVSSAPFVPGHFDLDPGGGRVGVANHTLGSVDILEASSLTRIRSISIGETPVLYVAFDPRGEALYALTRDGRFLVLDPATGEIRESIPLGPSGTGLSFNGTAVFGDGKYVAFDHGGDVVIVDTDLDLPRYRFRPEGGAVVHWSSLAATPDSEFLFVLNGPEGSLSKVRIR